MRIAGMATGAIACQLCTDSRCVTVGTLRLGMRASECETGVARMIEAGRRPPHRRVACGAVVAETALMRVLPGMTARAVPRERRREIGRMTGLAAEGAMGTFQREPGDHPVLEAAGSPAGLAMAVGTFRPVTSGMRIIVAMTRSAAQRRTDERLIAVTIDTVGFRMPIAQRKHRRRMIELSELPAFSRMTVHTTGTQRTHVNVIVAMTVTAALARLPECRSAFVTVGTLNFTVLTHERKVGKKMIERIGRKLHGIGVPPFVLLMTGRTVGRSGIRIQPVEADAIRAISEHVGMTAATKQILFLGLVGYMAAAAASLDACMSLDNRTRHDEALEVEHLSLCGDTGRCAHQEHRNGEQTCIAAGANIRHQ